MDNSRDVRVINWKWILKKKRTVDGKVGRFNARLVIFRNQGDVPILHTFAPVVQFIVVRLMMAIESQKKWKIHQIEYTNAFLQGNLEQDIHMSVPMNLGGDIKDKLVLLRKIIYALREAPFIWYGFLSMDLRAIGLEAMESVPWVFRENGVISF